MEKRLPRIKALLTPGEVAKRSGVAALRDELDGCIGCGCLSRSDCPLRNPGDRLGEQGTGARLLEED